MVRSRGYTYMNSERCARKCEFTNYRVNVRNWRTHFHSCLLQIRKNCLISNVCICVYVKTYQLDNRIIDYIILCTYVLLACKFKPIANKDLVQNLNNAINCQWSIVHVPQYNLGERRGIYLQYNYYLHIICIYGMDSVIIMCSW